MSIPTTQQIQEFLDLLKTLASLTAFLAGGIICFIVISYLNDNLNKSITAENNLLKYELETTKSNNARKIEEIKNRYITLESKYKKLVNDQEKHRKTAFNYCEEQKRLIRVLQKNFQLETRMTINYEYLSILEKVMLKLHENSGSCSKAMNFR